MFHENQIWPVNINWKLVNKNKYLNKQTNLIFIYFCQQSNMQSPSNHSFLLSFWCAIAGQSTKYVTEITIKIHLALLNLVNNTNLLFYSPNFIWIAFQYVQKQYQSAINQKTIRGFIAYIKQCWSCIWTRSLHFLILFKLWMLANWTWLFYCHLKFVSSLFCYCVLDKFPQPIFSFWMTILLFFNLLTNLFWIHLIIFWYDSERISKKTDLSASCV